MCKNKQAVDFESYEKLQKYATPITAENIITLISNLYELLNFRQQYVLNISKTDLSEKDKNTCFETIEYINNNIKKLLNI